MSHDELKQFSFFSSESEVHMKDKVRTGRGYCCYSTHVCTGEACATQNESTSAGVTGM